MPFTAAQSQATPKGLILFVTLLPSLGEPDVLNPSFLLPDYRDPAPLILLRPHFIPDCSLVLDPTKNFITDLCNTYPKCQVLGEAKHCLCSQRRLQPGEGNYHQVNRK